MKLTIDMAENQIKKILDQNDIKLSTEAIGIIIASFLTIRQVQVNDKIISSQIQKINDQYDKFITFCDDTKSLSNALVNYSNDILSAVEVIEEKNFKREDLVDFLNSLLSAARENKTKSENYESQIKQIQDNLEGIIEELFKYRGEISKDIKNIESDTKEKLVSTEKKEKTLKIVRNIAIGTGIALTGAAVATAVTGAAAVSGAVAAVEFVEVFLGMSVFTTRIATLASAFLSVALSYGTYKSDSALKESISANEKTAIILNTKLEDDRDRFLNVIKMINEELKAIVIHNINIIVNHWEEQVNSLSANIEKLESGKLKLNLNVFDTTAISRNAKEIKEQAREYHRIMNLIPQINLLLKQ
ncbi:hypothetical protein Glove_423g37 [Diversispora epigaea]|uniref:Uncharacterized protein n=1 Tax=Diversispora epigaea TaxID=1348612 RepID=A0A397GUV8_9GLOM|nr:hypothetical protein Glove_423g37 [Diversispora epigaea]